MNTNKLRSHLDCDVPVDILETIDSTNTAAKDAVLDGAVHGSTIIALHQTGGRGRLGRSFHSPAGTGIYMSTVLRIGSDINRAMLITAAASVAVCRAMRHVCGVDPKIKWVNDIYLNNKKVCGILTEAVTDPDSGKLSALVVGIGINTSVDGFPEELLEIAGAVDGNFSRSELAAQIINQLLTICENLDSRTFMNEYRRDSLVLGKTIKVYKSGYSPEALGSPARVLDIDNSGGLHVIYSDGSRETLSSGEISIRL